MVDEIYDRGYKSGRAELNSAIHAGLAHLVRAALAPFTVLNRIEYDAPWATGHNRKR